MKRVTTDWSLILRCHHLVKLKIRISSVPRWLAQLGMPNLLCGSNCPPVFFHELLRISDWVLRNSKDLFCILARCIWRKRDVAWPNQWKESPLSTIQGWKQITNMRGKRYVSLPCLDESQNSCCRIHQSWFDRRRKLRGKAMKLLRSFFILAGDLI